MTILSTILLAATAAASVPYRGVVEGYYGRPWGTEGRISLMDFMGERNLNTFVYGPKDDPYHHAKWREPYPAREAADFQKLLAEAKENGINFYWAVHLGNFASEYEALFGKLESMYALGVRAFAVFFDDFGSADAELHATIGNRVIREFLEKKGDCSPLLVCPNVYWGSGHPYQRALGEKLDARAMIMWTGRSICSDIRAEDVAKIAADFRRPPFIWWNWPVNDYCRSKVLLGRLYGLDACSYAGVVLNPMENCELNKVAVNSFGEWCKNPALFDSAKAWDEGFAKIFADAEVAAAMRTFASHNSDQGPNGHGYHREESVGAEPLCRAARAALAERNELPEDLRTRLRALFADIERASLVLVRKLPETNPEMFWELEGWLRDELHTVACGQLAVDMLESREPRQKQQAVRRLYAERCLQRADWQAHMEKFRAATFENDRRSIKPPRASDKEILPTVAVLMRVALEREYRSRTGCDFADAFGLKAFSRAAALPKLVPFTETDAAGLERVFEPRSLAPGEWFGLKLPDTVGLTSVDVRLGSESAQKSCRLEVSKDWETWQEASWAVRSGGRFFAATVPADLRWSYVRVRNVSEAAVEIRLNLFRLGVKGAIDPVDALLEKLVER